jgi:hypothetical protein
MADARQVEILEGLWVPHLRRWAWLSTVHPELTLRLRSGQAHWANICRVLQKTADANGAPPALRRKREFEEFLVGEPVMSDMNVRPPKENPRPMAGGAAGRRDDGGERQEKPKNRSEDRPLQGQAERPSLPVEIAGGRKDLRIYVLGADVCRT